MYSVVAHQNYRKRDRSPRPQSESSPTGGHTDSHRKLSFYQRIYRYVKQQFQQEKDEETDEFNFHIARYRPEELQKLASKTKFTRKEIQLMYRGFKQECPTGMVDEDSFKQIFSQFFPLGDATNYAHYVFNTIKQKQTGKISFEDFLSILSKVSRGSVQEKLQWVFGLYDLNGDGLITKTEMVDVVSSIYEMLGRATHPTVNESSAKEHVEKIFHLIDTNKDGVVTIEELVQWCSRDEHVLKSLETLDTVL
ncbi:Kv channel-interacting protein 1 isoform X1 [Tribolium castaneum]|uniref:Kv channel-interacting protein 1 isoform X1 n=1 Tax=Tribolium castaneum TaxID=7070 RepID=UPI00077DED37|nr:PREDICTED: Kv channel-interacting protein 1 isoform X1 [Tribolium castaneum]|eukprot:XP_015833120.1 PREDICTED: Kv channel-interacting protein 1 isoform X1 [Tribolium castaneum]